MAPLTFQLVTPDLDYSEAMATGAVNGGTVWLDNIAQALRYLGHKADLVSIDDNLSADYVIVQGEHINFEKCFEYAKDGKVICLLSHFLDTHLVYPPMDLVETLSWRIFTPWEGKLLDKIEVTFMPHAYNSLWNQKTQIKRGVVFAGNTYSLRNENWFTGLEIDRIYKTHPSLLPAIYRGADACLNLHGDFQKNIVSNEPNRTADKPGMMINERFWSVLGSGGLLITDWVPQMSRWFSKDELITADSKEEYQDLVSYYKDHKQEGLNKLSRAIEKVRNEHTYIKRVEKMLSLC